MNVGGVKVGPRSMNNELQGTNHKQLATKTQTVQIYITKVSCVYGSIVNTHTYIAAWL